MPPKADEPGEIQVHCVGVLVEMNIPGDLARAAMGTLTALDEVTTTMLSEDHGERYKIWAVLKQGSSLKKGFKAVKNGLAAWTQANGVRLIDHKGRLIIVTSVAPRKTRRRSKT